MRTAPAREVALIKAIATSFQALLGVRMSLLPGLGSFHIEAQGNICLRIVVLVDPGILTVAASSSIRLKGILNVFKLSTFPAGSPHGARIV